MGQVQGQQSRHCRRLKATGQGHRTGSLQGARLAWLFNVHHQDLEECQQDGPWSEAAACLHQEAGYGLHLYAGPFLLPEMHPVPDQQHRCYRRPKAAAAGDDSEELQGALVASQDPGMGQQDGLP